MAELVSERVSGAKRRSEGQNSTVFLAEKAAEMPPRVLS